MHSAVNTSCDQLAAMSNWERERGACKVEKKRGYVDGSEAESL